MKGRHRCTSCLLDDGEAEPTLVVSTALVYDTPQSKRPRTLRFCSDHCEHSYAEALHYKWCVGCERNIRQCHFKQLAGLVRCTKCFTDHVLRYGQTRAQMVGPDNRLVAALEVTSEEEYILPEKHYVWRPKKFDGIYAQGLDGVLDECQPFDKALLVSTWFLHLYYVPGTFRREASQAVLTFLLIVNRLNVSRSGYAYVPRDVALIIARMVYMTANDRLWLPVRNGQHAGKKAKKATL